MEKKQTVTMRILAALQNGEEKPEPKGLGPVAEGEKVLGRVTPAAQAIYWLAEDLTQEFEAEQQAKAGTSACCTSCNCMGLTNQIELVRGLFFLVANDQAGHSFGVRSSIRSGWTLIDLSTQEEDADEAGEQLPESLAELLRSAGIRGSLSIITIDRTRREAANGVQEV